MSRKRNWTHKYRPSARKARCECWRLYDPHQGVVACNAEAHGIVGGRRLCWTHLQIVKEGRSVEYVEVIRA